MIEISGRVGRCSNISLTQSQTCNFNISIVIVASNHQNQLNGIIIKNHNRQKIERCCELKFIPSLL